MEREPQKADVIVIGGGASGLPAAICAAERGDRVILLEAQEQIGKKILASGNGRCNIMNIGPLRYYGDAAFAEKVFSACDREKITAFLKHWGLYLSAEGDLVYPATFQAKSVVLAFKNALTLLHVPMLCGHRVVCIRKERNRFFVQTQEECFEAKRVILSSGGAAAGKLGGCEDGYRFLKSLGHPVTEIRPALVPILTDLRSISGLSGIRIRCRLTLLHGKTEVHREEGEALFGGDGVSGICAMQMARFLSEETGFVLERKKGKQNLNSQKNRTTNVNLKYQEQENWLEMQTLHRYFESPAEVVNAFEERKKRVASLPPTALLTGLLPEKMAYAVCKQAGQPMRGETIGDLSHEQMLAIAESALHYRMRITGTKGMEMAQVSAGGADTAFFSTRTMESRIVSGLHVTGEVLNVDGDCGGYNLMFALATGILAGENGRLGKDECR